MKSEPKTPLQLRAQSMVKEDEALEAAESKLPVVDENQPAEPEGEDDERKDVRDIALTFFRMNHFFLIYNDALDFKSVAA